MAVYARVQSGVVVELYSPPQELAATPLAELFHPSLQWIDIGNLKPAPQVRWTYDGKVFSPPGGDQR